MKEKNSRTHLGTYSIDYHSSSVGMVLMLQECSANGASVPAGPRSLDDAVFRLLSESMEALPHRSYSAFSSPMVSLLPPYQPVYVLSEMYT